MNSDELATGLAFAAIATLGIGRWQTRQTDPENPPLEDEPTPIEIDDPTRQ